MKSKAILFSVRGCLLFQTTIVIRSQYLHSLMALMATDLDFKKNQKRLDTSTMALEALRNVIKNNPGKKRHSFSREVVTIFGQQ